MKWLVTGCRGMLGTEIVDLLAAAGEQVSAVDLAQLDITDADAVDRAVAGHDVVFNAAGWTAVDDAEEHEAQATRVNGDAVGHLARAAAAHGAWLVHISTDYVFDGAASEPYHEDHPTDPASAYGRSKAAGEVALREALPDAHLLLRTAWLYGAHGACFPRTIARVAEERGQVDVVTDQVGQPTWARDVADLALRLVQARVPAGTYHATSQGQCSWFDFAQAVVVAAGLESSTVQPTTSDRFVRPAPRPAYSVLGHGALEAQGIEPIGNWEQRWAEAATGVLHQHA